MKRKWINIFVCCILSTCCNAQIEGFKFYAALDTVKTSGFYNIALTPQINAHLKTDYNDVRIVNADGKWVPHALHVPALEITKHAASTDLKFSLAENNKTNSIFLFEGKKMQLKNIELKIRNTGAERYCSLSGSDDGKNWFVINDSIFINPIPAEEENRSIFKIYFPLSNYSFYKLIVFNSNKNPYDVNGITTSFNINDPTIYQTKISSNPATIISQKDSNKISYIKIIQQHPYHFDGFNIKVSAVKYFNRTMDLYVPNDAKHSFSNPGTLLQSYTISNNSNLSFRTPTIKDSVFYLLIRNEDNLPLKVNEVSTTLNEPIIKAYLEAGNSYRLILENENATQPNYDITKLNLSIRDTAPFLKPKNIIAFPLQEKAEAKKEDNNKWMVWAALIAGLAILLLLTKKMLKEVDKKINNDTI
jgi:hypothetical protein